MGSKRTRLQRELDRCESNVWRVRTLDVAHKNVRISNPRNIPVYERKVVNKFPAISQLEVSAETGHQDVKRSSHWHLPSQMQLVPPTAYDGIM